MLELRRDLCADPRVAGEREWLVTNGLGGYAAGTVAGLLTRRYHGLLVAALAPPLGRTLLVAKLDETAVYDAQTYPLHANRWASGAVTPAGFHHLERFQLDGTTPVWTFALADALLEKRVWMEPDANTTYLRYDLRRASLPLTLSLTALVNYRDYHATTRGDGWTMRVEPVAHGLRVTAFDGAVPYSLLSDRAAATPSHDWYRGFHLSAEAERGLDDREDHLAVGVFRATLAPGQSLTLVASTEPAPELDAERAYARRQAHEARRLEEWAAAATVVASRPGSAFAPALPPASSQSALSPLVLAADQFIVRRPLAEDPDGRTVIAGYPWFGDWGRDTMIALPGLTLATGRPEIAARILRTFARFVDQGMLPNRFPDAGDQPEYNTVDATLWYVEAIRAYVAAAGDERLARDLFPVLADIIAWHQRGTRYGIRVDPADGLLHSGESGVQLTWMDAKIGDWVVTPRTGKAVEINALWYHALRVLADLAARLGHSAGDYAAEADRVAASFGRFWNAAAGCLYDVIDGPAGDDASVRPNQLLAVSLAHSPLDDQRQRAVVDTCARHLLTAHGLRSLAPDHPAYVGRYGGPPAQRDAVYHQGAVWAWLIGPFVRAHLRVYRDPALARSFLEPLLAHVTGGCLGSIGELFDGDAPFAPRGCLAQAWSVGEVLRAWRACQVAEEAAGG